MYTIGLPVARCSSPNSAMMAVPDAGLLPRMPRPMRSREGAEDLLGETLGIGGEGRRRHQAHVLPVTHGGVLAGGAASASRPGRQRGVLTGGTPDQGHDVAQTQLLQKRQAQVDDAAQVAQRVGAGVAVVGGVGQSAHAHPVQHDEDETAHTRPSPTGPEDGLRGRSSADGRCVT